MSEGWPTVFVHLRLEDLFIPYTNHVGDIPKARDGRAHYSSTTLMTETVGTGSAPEELGWIDQSQSKRTLSRR